MAKGSAFDASDTTLAFRPKSDLEYEAAGDYRYSLYYGNPLPTDPPIEGVPPARVVIAESLEETYVVSAETKLSLSVPAVGPDDVWVLVGTWRQQALEGRDATRDLGRASVLVDGEPLPGLTSLGFRPSGEASKMMTALLPLFGERAHLIELRVEATPGGGVVAVDLAQMVAFLLLPGAALVSHADRPLATTPPGDSSARMRSHRSRRRRPARRRRRRRRCPW